MVSHQRIYQFVYQDKCNGGELYKNLRTGNKKRHKKYGGPKPNNTLANMTSFELRPEFVNNK